MLINRSRKEWGGFQQRIKLFLLLCIPIALHGCATYPVYEAPPKHVLDISQNKKLCLALSGGGVRAGAVSLGVLQELHKNETLKEIDVVASVSGGGYPVYGILQHLKRNVSLDDLLSNGSRFIEKIDNKEFIPDDEVIISGALDASVGNLWFLLIKALNLVNSQDSPDPSALSSSYSSKINKKFGGDCFWWPQCERPLVKVDNLDAAGFPYPIFIAAAHYGGGAPNEDHEYYLDDQFEISPKWMGSKRMGIQTTLPKHFDVIHAVTASSAAIDTPARQNCILMPNGKCLSMKLRQKVENIIPNMAKALNIETGIPIKFGGKSVFLADGGFIENTAILPLARKKCDEIIAIDSTSDPDSRFTDLLILKQFVEGLEGELDIPLSITNSLGQKASGWNALTSQHNFDILLDGHRSKIRYLKLGINRALLAEYPQEVTDYVDMNWGGEYPSKMKICQNEDRPKIKEAPTCGSVKSTIAKKTCSFPHETTFRLCYIPEEFKAYRYLGRHLVSILNRE